MLPPEGVSISISSLQKGWDLPHLDKSLNRCQEALAKLLFSLINKDDAHLRSTLSVAGNVLMLCMHEKQFSLTVKNTDLQSDLALPSYVTLAI